MASISPSSYPPSLQMASVSPFPTSHCWYYTMRVQISGHFSVQSSSTFGSRKARKPIYILRFKKIEQGQLLYPKICPPIFLKICQDWFPNCSRWLKGYTVKLLPKAAEIRVLVLSRNLRFSMVKSSLIGLYTFSSTYMPSFKTHSANLHSQKLHWIYSQLQGQNGHFAVKSQNFWSTSYFEFTIIIWSSLDHDSTRIAQKSSRCKKLLFLDSRKVNCILTKA